MIFYFSGTGNSLYAAKMVKTEEEALYDIAGCVKSRNFSFEVEEGEAVGIVCPVYYGGLPSIVVYFLNKLVFSGNDPAYIYAITTHGGNPGAVSDMISGLLEKKGYILDAIYPVRMPANYVLLYNTAAKETIDDILAIAEVELVEIAKQIDDMEIIPVAATTGQKMTTGALYPLYKKGRKTKDFYADDRCIGCGKCAKNCPAGAIKLVNGKPAWVKDQCIYCMSCISRCSAIQFGKKTQKRRRYLFNS